MTTPSPSSLLPSSALQGAARCDHWGVIRAEGEDAAKFLHGQLTHDFALLDQQHARLASFCSAKGRMQASFVGFKQANGEILLVCSRDVLPATLKRLSMFVMRAKAKLSDASDAFAVWGLAGASVAAELPAEPWSLLHGTDGSATVRLYPANGVARAVRVAPVDLPAPAGPEMSIDQWQWLEVMSGVVGITLPTVEAFVPQMLNHESVGGVNFKKGCYPGQEVVARSQFRGTLKRRAYVMASEEPVSVGQEVFHASDAEQPCGTVAAAAPNPLGGWNAVVSMQVSAAGGGELRAASASGPLLTPLPLPYPLLDDI
ncbi:MAG: folate-binding protein [Hydrogenophaga sp.]